MVFIIQSLIITMRIIIIKVEDDGETSTGKDSDETHEAVAVGIGLVRCLLCLRSEQLKFA